MPTNKLILLVPLMALLAGCMSTKWHRLIPENKDAQIDVSLITPWGQETIHVVTKVSTNFTGKIK